MNAKSMDEELKIFILNELEKKPDSNQRELAKKFEVSLGKINFVVKKLNKIQDR